MKLFLQKIFMLLGFLAFSLTLHSQAPLSADSSTRSIFMTEFANFKGLLKGTKIKDTELDFSSVSGTTHVTTDNLIHVNLKGIERHTAGQSIGFKKLFIRYVIAHELGHKIQSKYITKLLGDSRSEALITAECNADILAGMLIYELGYDINKEWIDQQNGDYEHPLLSQVYKHIVRSQTVERNRTYPSNDERFNAFRQGLSLGKYTMIRQRSGTDTTLKSRERLYVRELGLDSSIEVLSWSVDEASRIVHNGNIYCRNLVIFNRTSKTIRKKPKDSLLYSFSVLNNNEVSVHFRGRVVENTRLFNFVSSDDDELRTWCSDGSKFDVIIEPHKTAIISGLLDDTPGSMTFYNFVVFPGDRGSFYDVADNDNRAMLGDEKMFGYDTNFRNWDELTIDRVVDFIYYYNEMGVNLLNLAKGIGVSEEKRNARVLKNFVKYEPAFTSDFQNKQEVIYNPQTHISRFSIMVYPIFKDHIYYDLKKNERIDHFRDMISTLNKVFGSGEVIRRRDSSGDIAEIKCSDQTLFIRLTSMAYSQYSDENNRVLVEIFKTIN